MRHTAVPSRRGRGCGRGGPARCDPGGPPLRRGAAAEGAQRGGRADRGGWGFGRATARPWWALKGWQNGRGRLPLIRWCKAGR